MLNLKYTWQLARWTSKESYSKVAFDMTWIQAIWRILTLHMSVSGFWDLHRRPFSPLHHFTGTFPVKFLQLRSRRAGIHRRNSKCCNSFGWLLSSCVWNSLPGEVRMTLHHCPASKQNLSGQASPLRTDWLKGKSFNEGCCTLKNLLQCTWNCFKWFLFLVFFKKGKVL